MQWRAASRRRRSFLATGNRSIFTLQMHRPYWDEGYLVVANAFAEQELRPVRERTDQLIADPGSAPAGVSLTREGDTVADRTDAAAGNTTLRAVAFMARFDTVFRGFAQTPALLELVRGLIGPRIKLFRDQMLLKPPGGQEKPVHQDQSYFRVQPSDALMTAWIPLDAATEANGCMRYVPGSHRYGILDVDHDPSRPVHHIPRTNGLQLRPEVLCPVPAGSVIFHHGCTLHRSGINSTETWRRAVVFHFATAESRSEREELNAEVTLEIDSPA